MRYGFEVGIVAFVINAWLLTGCRLASNLQTSLSKSHTLIKKHRIYLRIAKYFGSSLVLTRHLLSLICDNVLYLFLFNGLERFKLNVVRGCIEASQLLLGLLSASSTIQVYFTGEQRRNLSSCSLIKSFVFSFTPLIAFDVFIKY